MILVPTPCPCLDRILHLGEVLRPHALHRALRVEEIPGGKGLNLARAVLRLGGEASVQAPLGGYLGERILALAQEEGLPIRPLPGGGGRACHILWDGQGATEVYEPCPAWRPEGVLLRGGNGRVRVVSGSLPQGLEPEVVLEAFGPQAVDSVSLFRAALRARVPLIKPNREELRQLWDGEPLEAALSLHWTFGTAVLASLGEEGVIYAGQEGLFTARGPKASGNPVGSGDTLLGFFLWKRQTGASLEEALAHAVAATIANVGVGGGRVEPRRVEALLGQVEVRRP